MKRRNKRKLFSKELVKNKVYALSIIGVGCLTLLFADGDITALIFTLLMGIPLFFARKNYIV